MDGCARHGLPLLEIPERTPFIAITKAVSASLAAEAYAQVVRTDEAQRALSRGRIGTVGHHPGAAQARRAARGVGALSEGDGVVRGRRTPRGRPPGPELREEIERVRAHRGARA